MGDGSNRNRTQKKTLRRHFYIDMPFEPSENVPVVKLDANAVLADINDPTFLFSETDRRAILSELA